MNSKVIFRVEGTPEVGLGHVFRCLALAQGFNKSDYEVFFLLSKESKEACSEILINEGICHEFLSDRVHVGSEKDAQSLINKSKILNSRHVIIDGYQFKETFQRAIKESGLKSLIFDDFNYVSHFYSNFILNQNFFADTVEYVYDGRALLGPKYAILRDEFISTSIDRMKEVQRKVLISLGGSDKNNVTLWVLRIIQSNGLMNNCRLEIVLGSGNRHYEVIKKYCKENLSNQDYEIHHPSSHMSKLIATCDFGVFAGGTSVYEVMFLMLPCVFVGISDNQKPNLDWIKNHTEYPVVLTDDDNKEADLISALTFLLNGKICFNKRLVDGLGKYRIVNEVGSLLN